MKMQKFRKPFLLLLAYYCLIGAAALRADEGPALSWPDPPAEAKIVFIRTIRFPQDIGMRGGFFSRLKGLLIGKDEDMLNKPIDVAIDSERTVYVCDTGSPAVHIFEQKKKRYRKITTINKEELRSPVGVAAADNGSLFVSDSKLKKVFCIDKAGKLKFSVGGGRLLRPTGIAADKEKLYIVDTMAHKVAIFDLNGTFIGEFGKRGQGAGEFNYPTDIALSDDGRIYVVDTLNFRVEVFDKNNAFLFSIGREGDSSGSFSRPKGIDVDSFGHIYVTDGLFDNMQIFSQKNEFLLSLGGPGNKEGEFWMPSGAAIDKDDYIYVADSYNQRIQVFRYIGKD